MIRHAEGLDWHWQALPGPDGKRTFCRHAFVVERQVYGPNGGDDTNIGFDFPRHAGFFLVDVAYVYRHTRRPGLLLIAVARLASLLGPGFDRPVSPDYSRR